MRNFTTLASAAILAGAVSCFVPRTASSADAPAANPSKTNDEVKPLALPEGFTAKDLKDQDAIRSELARATNEAMTTDDFDKFVGELVSEDRDRVGQYKNRNQGEMNAKINTLRKLWKDKYGKDFDIEKEKDLFQPQSVTIMTGEVSDSAQAVRGWPVNPWTGSPSHKSDQAIAASAQEAGKTFGGKTDLDKGRNVALVRMAGAHGMPGLTLSMIHELPDHWRFDIPNDRNGKQIYNDLSAQIDYLTSHSSEWPGNVSDGYAMFSHHLLTAIYGTDKNVNSARNG